MDQINNEPEEKKELPATDLDGREWNHDVEDEIDDAILQHYINYVAILHHYILCSIV